MAEEESAPEVASVNPRRELMEQIVANDLENKVKEIEEGGGKREDLMPAEPEAKAAPEEAPAETPAEVPAETPAEAVAETPAPAEKTIKIKVDGKEQEVPESKVIEFGIKTLQKETAADARLVEANRAREEANRLLEHVKKNPEPSEDAPKAAAEDTRALAHAIQYGSEEEAAEALKKLKGNSGLTPEQAAAMIDERMAFRTAADWYNRECKDIASDPYLHRLFLDGEKRKRDAGDNRPYIELYGEIVKEVRDWKDGIAKATKPADPLAEKRAQKAQSTPQPTAASARKPAPQEQKEPTTSEVIAEMAAGRGRTRQLPDAMRARR